MSLIMLPTEVLTIIIRKLDVRSLYRLYRSCKYLRDLIRMPGVIQSCQFSKNALATVRSFNLPFFRDISSHLRVLNLSGVNDLHRSSLTPILNKLECLIDLDVSFTKITIPDYLVIIKAVPTLKSLAINFSFVGNHKIDNKSLLQYQQAFASLKNIHFVGRSTYLLAKKLAFSMLQKAADLCNVKFTICKHHSIVCGVLESCEWENTIQTNMSNLQIHYFVDLLDSPLKESRVFWLMNLNRYEIVIFQGLLPRVYATPLLQEFIRKNFDVEVENLDCLVDCKRVICEAAIMLWDKERNQFNSEFYGKLLVILREYLIFCFQCTEVAPVPSNYNRYWVDQYTPGLEGIEISEERAIKRILLSDRLSGSSFALNYDKPFQNNKDNIKLEIFFSSIFRPISLKNCTFLKMLSHLTLHNGVRFTPTFFKTLFESCSSLVTLEIIRQKGLVANTFKYMSRNKSLKNVLFYIKGSHLERIFDYFSECKNLENIHLVNTSRSFDAVDPLPDPRGLFTKCDRLYNFCYQSFMMQHERARALEEYKDIRSELGKHGLNIDMYPYSDSNTEYRYTPYVGVFDVFRFKPI